MILGVGIDLTPVDRMARLLERYPQRSAERLFTQREQAYCWARARPAEHFAARFAAKEATLKALGVPEGLSWHELEVVSRSGAPPVLELHGRAKEAARSCGMTRAHLSLSHAGGQATAIVILEGER